MVVWIVSTKNTVSKTTTLQNNSSSLKTLIYQRFKGLPCYVVDLFFMLRTNVLLTFFGMYQKIRVYFDEILNLYKNIITKINIEWTTSIIVSYVFTLKPEQYQTLGVGRNFQISRHHLYRTQKRWP